MKKFILILLIVYSGLMLVGCYQDMEKTSLEEYISFVKKNKFGFSNSGIDDPKYFLPSPTFIEDYSYIEGGYYWYKADSKRGLFTTNVRPEIAILYLKYDENIYFEAKSTMLTNIKPYNNVIYEYNNYIFYENSNEINITQGSRNFPKDFTMACYNDTNYVLLFIGFESATLAGPSCIDEKYINNIEENWTSFIDQYYGKYYNFSS